MMMQIHAATEPTRHTLGYTADSSLGCLPAGDVPLPIRKQTGAACGAGVHVRSTESLKALCSHHLELSGSRAYASSGKLGSSSDASG